MTEAVQITWMNWDKVADRIKNMGLRGVYVNEASGLISNSDDGVIGLAQGGRVVAREGDWIVDDGIMTDSQYRGQLKGGGL